MAFRGFDAARIRALAGDLDRLAGDSGRLHSQLATLLTTAQQNLPPGQSASRDPGLQGLVGDLIPMPSLFGGRRRLPGSLQGELGDMQGSMKRRVKQMEGLAELERLGYPVRDGSVFLDEKPPDAERIDAARRHFQDLRTTDFGTNGNRDDLERIAAELDGLTAAELDVFFSKSSPEELAFYNELLTDTGDSGWNPFDRNGLPEAERRETLSLMLSRISPQNVARFQTAFPGMQPTFTNTGAYEEGGNNQNGQTNNGIHWAPPTDPLFRDGVSADDVSQNQFGDCWYVASLAGLSQQNPRFIEEGIKENPNGTVSVRVWDKEGDHQWVTMTADLPTDQNGNPISTYGNGETWPAYYEKAFAMVYSEDGEGERGYGGIEGDDPKKAAPYLTGQEGEDLETGGFLGIGQSQDKDIDRLREAYESGQVVTLSTPDDESLDKDHPKEWGSTYHTNHAYYVRGFTDDGKVVLGNPWGVQGYAPITVSQDQLDKYFHYPEAFDVP
ncbi:MULTISPECIES: C2 family cysteine protease [Streptomyces]|uniref:C2 family cysteine protease n=1 Tax=Streptomyces TaxID=1883 RepID=UPI0003C2F97A|nr:MULTISPECIES: C2 family cysteine protease [unclassified Streptomyces]ESQ04731.1 peptidase C2 calpain [Streptomyces sp. PVA_94-07]QOZ99810.1 peptidase C2 calpain [Streptomyces violascens]